MAKMPVYKPGNFRERHFKMTRRRMSQEWRTGFVSEATVAPHRYLYTGMNDDWRYSDDYKTFMAGIPYREGEVVYIEGYASDGPGKPAKQAPLKARVIGLFYELDRYGDRREKYRIQRETKKGTWSLLWEYTFPGQIQRGYQQAGLAPEMPADA